MKQHVRESVRQRFREFGIEHVRRARPIDPTEEVFLISPSDAARIDTSEMAIALYDLIPHTKIWVIAEDSAWEAEDL